MPSTFVVDPKDSPEPVTPPDVPQIITVLDFTSLETEAGQPARLSNLSQSNLVSNVDRSSQNAVANQQAHSQLTLSILGRAVTGVQNLGPAEARSNVDILSNNEAAQTIADLKAAAQSFGGSSGGTTPPSLGSLLRRIVELINRRLEGDGTLARPFRLRDQGPLFARASVTFAFPGKTPGSLSFTATANSINVGS